MAGPWFYFDASLQAVFPGGIMAALLVTFGGLGILCLLYAAASPGRPLAAMGFHIAGGWVAIMAGDLVTLLIGWELLSLSAFFLIAGAGRRRALRAAWRYLVFQIAAAAVLFVGMAVQVVETGSWAVAVAVPDAQPYFLLAVAIKTAAIPLHGWLVDGYPAAPWAVSPLLSVYATKVGVYTAARLLALPPTAILGAVMALGGVVGALGQRTGRRLLSYHIISQVGYMLAGVGLATEFGITAGIFHAVNHIVYKGLLFMVMGAVLLRVGHDRLDRLGGLARAMPVTCAVGLVASASIAGVPFFNGFASKALLKAAVGPGGIGLLLTAASVGTGLSFIKFIYLVFLRPREEAYDRPPCEVPPVMLVPMILLAAVCVITGVRPSLVARGVAYTYYAPGSVFHAVLPLLGSAVLWGLFRRRLTAYVPTNVSGISRRIRFLARRMRSAALAAHGMDWQAALSAALVAWLILVLVWAR